MRERKAEFRNDLRDGSPRCPVIRRAHMKTTGIVDAGRFCCGVGRTTKARPIGVEIRA